MIDPIFEVKTERATAEFGIFTIEPLQQGYGQTLGNCLRRTLLSSLAGAAVTQVKVAGVKHQFGTIPGLKEDVVELILNIKKIRVAFTGDKPQKIVIDKTGPGQVTAGDIETPPGVEIVNKDLILGNLADKKSRLKVEMIIEVGYGYSFSEERLTSEVGVIPIDAVFSPVNRVNYHVSATRVGRMINWDKLTMEIWTDGTISPKKALIDSARILTDFFQQVITPKKEVKTKIEKEEKVSREILEMSVEELELPTRIANSLIKGGLVTVADLLKAGKKRIVKVKNLGVKSVKIVEVAIKNKGIELPE
jgi:DNA-directed RNA polymerase subunit alpha